MVNIFYTDKESPLRKSLADELEEYFKEHPDSQKSNNTQLTLHLPDSTDCSYQPTLEDSESTNKSEKSAYTDNCEKENTRTENSVKGFNLLPYDFSQNLTKCLQYTTDTDSPNLNECDEEEFTRDWLGKEKGIIVYSPNDEDKLKSGPSLKPHECEISSTQESTTSSSQYPASSSSPQESSSSSSIESSTSSSSANYASISHNDCSSLFQDNSDKTIGMSSQYLSSYDPNINSNHQVFS